MDNRLTIGGALVLGSIGLILGVMGEVKFLEPAAILVSGAIIARAINERPKQ